MDGAGARTHEQAAAEPASLVAARVEGGVGTAPRRELEPAARDGHADHVLVEHGAVERHEGDVAGLHGREHRTRRRDRDRVARPRADVPGRASDEPGRRESAGGGGDGGAHRVGGGGVDHGAGARLT